MKAKNKSNFVQLIKKNKLINKGSYSKLYSSDNDKLVFKKTSEIASKNLLSTLKDKKINGFVKVLDFQNNIFLLEKLYNIKNDELKESIENAYKNSLILSLSKFNIVAKNQKSAKIIAHKIATNNSKYKHISKKEFSIEILKNLINQCNNNKNGNDLKKAFKFLIKFIDENNYNIDLMHINNWMLNKNNNIVLSDPVVPKCWDF